MPPSSTCSPETASTSTTGKKISWPAAHAENGTLHIGSCAYGKVLVAGVDTLRSSTLRLLTDYAAQGGALIFAGNPPSFVDALPSGEAKVLASACTTIPLEEKALTEACSNGREIKIDTENASLLFARSYRTEGGRMILLLNTDRKKGRANAALCLGTGKYLEQWDPRTGKITEPEYQVINGHLTIDPEAGGERLYRIPARKRSLPKQEAFRGTRTFPPPRHLPLHPVRTKHLRPGHGSRHRQNRPQPAPMEVLKADRALRDHLRPPYRGGEMLQPWYQVRRPPEAFRKRRSAPGLSPSQGSHPGPERHPAVTHPPEYLRLLHHPEKCQYSYSPASFITEPPCWTDSYVLYEQGLLKKPEILY